MSSLWDDPIAQTLEPVKETKAEKESLAKAEVANQIDIKAGLTGFEDVQTGAGRIQVDDKKIIKWLQQYD